MLRQKRTRRYTTSHIICLFNLSLNCMVENSEKSTEEAVKTVEPKTMFDTVQTSYSIKQEEEQEEEQD